MHLLPQTLFVTEVNAVVLFVCLGCLFTKIITEKLKGGTILYFCLRVQNLLFMAPICTIKLM
jgi:hypothetical protein